MMREMTDGAREIAQFNLPFMDGNHECIPRIASGQQFFAEFSGRAGRQWRVGCNRKQHIYCQLDKWLRGRLFQARSEATACENPMRMPKLEPIW